MKLGLGTVLVLFISAQLHEN